MHILYEDDIYTSKYFQVNSNKSNQTNTHTRTFTHPQYKIPRPAHE